MAQAKQRSLDIAHTLPVAGSITITFYDADGHMVPEVSFAPLGRINPNTIERYLPYIYQQIQQEQAAVRNPAVRAMLRERTGGRP